MDIVVLFNGLGNQMSQYAFYLQKKKINGSTKFISFCKAHNGLELGKVFSININETFLQKVLYIPFRILITKKIKIIYPLKALLNFFKFKVIYENNNYDYQHHMLLQSRGVAFYFGGWPSEKYFIEVKEELLTAFKFSEPDDIENIAYTRAICESNSVAIHVRRGDYLSKENIGIFGGVCNKAYFEKAIEVINSMVKDPHFFVFSNDIIWVKANLRLDKVTFVTGNNAQNSWKDMRLMSICKHNVISNSTFSWWGAWLNKNKDKIVVCPSRYLNTDITTDVYPVSWTKIFDY